MIAEKHQSTSADGSNPSIRLVLNRNWLILYKRLPLFLAVIIAVTGSGITYLAFQPAVYVTKATVMFEQSDSKIETLPFLSFNSVLSEVPPHEFFKSVLNSLLYRKRLAETISAAGYTPPENLSLEEAILRNLKFSIQKNDVFADITSREANAQAAFMMVNLALTTFIERSREIQREEIGTKLSFLDGQLKVISDKLEKLEREIQEFQEKNRIDPTDIDRGVWGDLYDLQRQLIDTEVALSLEQLNHKAYGARFARTAQEIALDLGGNNVPRIVELKEGIARIRTTVDSLLATETEQPQIENLQKELQQKQTHLLTAISSTQSSSPKLHQERRSMLEALIIKRTESELNLVVLRNKLDFIEERIRQFKRNHPDLLESALSYTRLIRSKEVLKDTFNLLMEKREEANIRAASETGGIKVIDPPYLPAKPENPQSTFYIAFSLLLGILLGFGSCFAADLFDDSFKEPEDVEQILKLSIMGVIPRIRNVQPTEQKNSTRRSKSRGHDRRSGSLLISKFPPDDPVVEAYRSLKTNLTFSSPDDSLKTITISSPQVGEGKSVTAANLAISFATSGIKTLVVDCDMRRPIQHEIFRLDQTPGLTDALFNDISDPQYYRETGIKDLTLVTVGTNTPSPADLLNSDKMREFLSLVEKTYEIVLIDTPPITFAVDARLLASRTDGMILVIQNERTKINAAKVSISHVHQIGGKIIGCVVNMVNRKRLYKNYYYVYNN